MERSLVLCILALALFAALLAVAVGISLIAAAH